jgi:hypothetical protein
MATQPEVIRTQIASTREDLAHDIDRLADRTSPRRIVRRRWDSMRERVMGAPREVTTTVREAPEAVARTTQGNPVAAGLIAFGAGLLAASLLPETDAEAASTTAQRARESRPPAATS